MARSREAHHAGAERPHLDEWRQRGWWALQPAHKAVLKVA
ncbi:hypothetical protein [Luteococcus sp. H101]